MLFSILMIPKLLNLFCPQLDDLNYVFILLIVEKLCSHVNELMGRVSATCISLYMIRYISLEST